MEALEGAEPDRKFRLAHKLGFPIVVAVVTGEPHLRKAILVLEKRQLDPD